MKNQNSKNKILIRFLGLSLIIYSLLPIIAAAQFELPTIGSVKPTIILNSNPVTPLPNSTITLTANLSGVTGIGGSNYVWFLNGARQTGDSGLNRNTFAFKADAVGSVYAISVSVTTPSADILSDAINLTVSDFDLTWDSNSQAPVFYRAKLMPAQNSLVTISALPFIYRPGTKSLIGSSSLTYNWMSDGKIDSLKSGLNKSTYAFRAVNFPGNPHFVRLEIKTMDGAVSLSKEALIPVVKPQVLLYFSDPATNLPYGAALKNLTVRPASFNFTAQTYFFSAPIKNLKWLWFINNAEVSGETEKPWLATLDLANDFSGAFSAQIKVTVQNSDNELEIAEAITNLEVR